MKNPRGRRPRGVLRSAVLALLGSSVAACDGSDVRAGLAPEPARQYDVVPAEIGVREAAAEVATFALAALEPLGSDLPPDVEGFHDELVTALEVYLDGTREAFDAYALERGLEIDWVQRLADDGRLPIYWESKSKTLRLAPLGTGDVEVRPRTLRGRELHYEDATTVVLAERPGRVPWLPSREDSRVDVFEVIVSAEMAAERDGEDFTFPGRVGLWLAYHDENARWVLLSIAIYDAPEGTSLGMPPL